MKSFRFILFMMPIFILCCTLVISCGDDGESSDNGDNSSDDDDIASDDDDNDDSEPDAISSATPGVNSTMLSASHAGWKKADCMSCHQDAHNNGFENPECHTCHGNNGAPRRTAGHDNSDCFSCHTTQHPEAEFQSPSDCRMCHGFQIFISSLAVLCVIFEQGQGSANRKNIKK